jgi:hypothetical protein
MRRRLRAARIGTALALTGAPMLAAGLCQAGEPGPVTGSPGTEVMLYVSQPIGPSSLSRHYGLRIDRHTTPLAASTATSNAAELAGRREIVNLSLARHEDLRIAFGRRVSWDFSRHELHLPTDLPSLKSEFRSRPASTPRLPLP